MEMATNVLEATRPAWQTDDLVEEWVEEDEDEASLGTQSISLTEPLPGFLQTPSTDKDTLSSPTSPNAGGTFLIREDMPAAALLPKTPGRQINKGGIKDFFSPLALEKMFEPPSPPPQKPAALGFTAAPAIPSRLSQAFTPNDSQSESETNQVDHDSLKPTSSTDHLAPPSSTHGARSSSLESPFTFSVPCHSPKFPQAESTPGNVYSIANPPMTDPRLRLFQLQYDTFTRDHLSAIVDSIAVNNTPSGGSAEGNGSSSSLFQRAAFYGQQTPVSDDTPIRSIKRVKLSPPSDFYGEGAGAGATVSRPTSLRVDYVGESRSLMQQIKQARDFSTISTTVTTQSPASQNTEKSHGHRYQHYRSDHRNGLVPITAERSRTTTGSSTAAPSGHSSLAIRLQAESLMQQIKNDMKGSKRLFSGDTELSRFTLAEEDPADGAAAVNNRSHHSAWSGTQERSRRTSPKIASPRRPSSSRHQPSPRKFSRSVSDDHERSLVHEMSNMSIEVPWQTDERSAATRAELSPNTNIPHIRVTSSTITLPLPPTQIPRSYPSSSLRSGDNDDLNRFVSSSTASGTTITASSAPSFVKHAGPVHITHIAPSDVPSLPQRVGKMVYDKDLMKWMKATVGAVSEADDQRDQTAGTDAESEDPFRDIESLREDDSGGMSTSALIIDQDPAVEEEEGVEEEEEDFKQDMTRIEEVEEETNDQEEVDLTSFTFDGPSVAAIRIIPSEEDDTDAGDETSEFESDDDAADAEHHPSQPVFDSEDDLSNVSAVSPRKPLPVQRLVTAVETTPITASRRVSVLVTPMPSKPALKSMSTTPISYLISAQRVCNLQQYLPEVEDLVGESPESTCKKASIIACRSQENSKLTRVLEILHQLSDPFRSSRREATRTLTGVKRRHTRPNIVVAVVGLGAQPSDRPISFTIRKANRSPVSKFLSGRAELQPAVVVEWYPRLRADTFCRLQYVCVTSYSHLQNLENLDISDNEIESLSQLQCLRHLRELRADRNQITSLDGLQKLDALTKLSLQGNLIGEVDFNLFRWPRLEMLNLSDNQLVRVTSLALNLPALIALNVDGNLLEHLDPGGSMGRMRILRASNNRLHKLNVAHYANLRTLYLDNNSLPGLVKAERLGKLENLSMRNQSCRDL
ncbi:hypothetical protein PAXINDRAFT_12196 [Paxillus involutus ATCC 200175]|uniref:Uncharacterized protein n=1 Tax=Paxillus involutus ATCC 200175 TaxID=664439 RepID=A0A0C9U6Y3_PAXIN|nr:hypothetical protein PAXINDRAFT_12196 [Paxillus involutus ATCC 200175]